MEKHVLDRRLEQMTAEGVRFQTRAHVGGNVPAEDLRKEFDAVLLAGGAESPRDLKVPGRELKGIHFAMEFLPQQNKRNAGRRSSGPDSGHRQARGDHRRRRHRRGLPGHVPPAEGRSPCSQFEIMPMPPAERAPSTPWPLWPLQLRTESSHEEGGMRDWAHRHHEIHRRRERQRETAARRSRGPAAEIRSMPGTEFAIDADLVLLALGFPGPVKQGMIEQFGVNLDARSNIATGANYMSSVPGVFAAGDMRRGQSLVVWAISEGRKAAASVDKYLMGSSSLA